MNDIVNALLAEAANGHSQKEIIAAGIDPATVVRIDDSAPFDNFDDERNDYDDNYCVGAYVHVGSNLAVWEVIARDGDKMTIVSPRGAKRTVTLDTKKYLPAVF